MNETVATIHPFERAGLGKAPYRVTGSYESKYQAIPGDPNCPIQPGSSCDYCAAGIMLVVKVRSADGRDFKVGCDCAGRVYQECAATDLERDARRMRDAVNKIKREHSHRRDDTRIEAACALFEAHRETFSDMWETPPPAKYARSWAEYIDWMLEHAGRTGRVKVARIIERMVAQIERQREAA